MTDDRTEFDRHDPGVRDAPDDTGRPTGERDDTGRPTRDPDAGVFPGEDARNAPTIAPEEEGEVVDTEHAPGADL